MKYHIFTEMKFSVFWMLVILSMLLQSVSPNIFAQENSNNMVIDPNTSKVYLYDNKNRSISVIDGNTDKIISHLPLGGSSHSETNFDPNLLISYITLGGGLVTAFVGLRTYHQSQLLRKKDILKDIIYPLIDQFYDSKEMYIAKQILDDVPVKNLGYFDKNRLSLSLRDHRKDPSLQWQDGDGLVRGSFDAFLDFLGKLESLVLSKLVTKKDISLFYYFIDKAGSNNAVVNYVRTYKFPLYGKLHPELNSGSEIRQ